MSLGPRAIGLGEMALRVVARPGAWFALLAAEPEVTAVADQLAEEIAMLGDTEPRRADGGTGAVAIATEARDAGGRPLVIAGVEGLGDEEWRRLDLLRGRIVRDEPVVLVLSRRAFERLMRNAPNIASLLGGAVWTLDPTAEVLTEEEKERRLRGLRAWSGLSDAELVARAERGALPLEPEHAEWLVLLGRGDLLERR